jgi:amino acid transporter
MALNGTVVAGRVGQAVPLVFALAAVGAAFVAYGFIRLTRHFSHAGSVYAFSGATLGPRAGFFSGWALLGTYLALTVGSSAEVGLFAGEFLSGVGLARVDWLLIALVALALVGLLAYADVKVATRTLLGVEIVTVGLIVVLVVVILVRIAAGDAPRGQELTLDVFTPNGVPRPCWRPPRSSPSWPSRASRAPPRWARRRRSRRARSRSPSAGPSPSRPSSTCWP